MSSRVNNSHCCFLLRTVYGRSLASWWSIASAKRWTSITLTTLLLSSTSAVLGSAYADQAQHAILRGADGAAVTVAEPSQNVALRGGIVEDQVVELNDNLLANNAHDTGFLPGMRASLSYLRDNTIPELFFRGSTDALSDRDVTYSLPDYGSLRNSMMHSVNSSRGLRGGEATIADTVSASLRGSYLTRAQMERANVDRARMHGAFANFLPKVNGSIEARNRYSQETPTSSQVHDTKLTAGIEVSMPLFTSGVNMNSYRRAQHLSLASDYTYMAEEHRVALEAIASHINLRLNRAVEKTLRGNVHAMQRIAKIARTLFVAGDASRTDIAIADANVQSAKAELDLARKSREEVAVDYESLTGMNAPTKLKAGQINRLVPRSLEQALDTAVRFNPTLVAASHTAVASRHAAKAERGRYGPQVNLFGNYNRDIYSSAHSEQSEDWRVGVRLTVPLFDLTSAPNIAAVRHEALESGYHALDQERAVKRQIKREWVAYNSAKRRTGIVQKQVNAIKRSVIGTRKEFEAGYRSISDVLTDQIRLARAQITLETARHERMLAAYQLVITTADPALKNLPAVRLMMAGR